MDVMQGYDRAIIVDAMLTGAAPGALRDFTLADLVTTKNTVSSHDGDLQTALAAGRLAGLTLPGDVRIVGVEAVDVVTFAERLTPAVACAVPAAAARVQALLEEGAP
jgi:hydrogenase maturation protease